jgi:hypothetical protein
VFGYEVHFRTGRFFPAATAGLLYGRGLIYQEDAVKDLSRPESNYILEEERRTKYANGSFL